MDYKGDKEFIFIVNGEVWKVYAKDEIGAKVVFMTDCIRKAKTGSVESVKYWTDLNNLVSTNKHIVVENTDFYGVRKVTG